MYIKKEDFFKELSRVLSEYNIKFDKDWWIDHICYRTKTLKEYEDLTSYYSKNEQFLIESMVGGRLISSFKFYKPLQFQKYHIPLIEIPAPKAGKIVSSGYEHIEIVCTNTFEELKERFKNLPLKTSALSKRINPELIIQFETIAIKFHHQSLEEVINIEKEEL